MGRVKSRIEIFTGTALVPFPRLLPEDKIKGDPTQVHIFELRGLVYPVVMKLAKQCCIHMLAHLTSFLILNFGHVTL